MTKPKFEKVDNLNCSHVIKKIKICYDIGNVHPNTIYLFYFIKIFYLGVKTVK